MGKKKHSPQGVSGAPSPQQGKKAKAKKASFPKASVESSGANVQKKSIRNSFFVRKTTALQGIKSNSGTSKSTLQKQKVQKRKPQEWQQEPATERLW